MSFSSLAVLMVSFLTCTLLKVSNVRGGQKARGMRVESFTLIPAGTIKVLCYVKSECS